MTIPTNYESYQKCQNNHNMIASQPQLLIHRVTFEAFPEDTFTESCGLAAYPAFLQSFMCLEMKQPIIPVIVCIWMELGASCCSCYCCDRPHVDCCSLVLKITISVAFFFLDTINWQRLAVPVVIMLWMLEFLCCPVPPKLLHTMESDIFGWVEGFFSQERNVLK